MALQGVSLASPVPGPALAMWGFPKIRGTFLGVPMIRILVFWGLRWGPLVLGNYHVDTFQGVLQGIRSNLPGLGITRVFRGIQSLGLKKGDIVSTWKTNRQANGKMKGKLVLWCMGTRLSKS